MLRETSQEDIQSMSRKLENIGLPKEIATEFYWYYSIDLVDFVKWDHEIDWIEGDEFLKKTNQIEKESGYSNDQLREIFKGLQHNINVTPYLDHKYDDMQMRVIRYSLEKNYDISIYTNNEMSTEKMKVLYYAIENGLDFKQILECDEKKTSASQLCRKIYNEKIGLDKYVDKGFSDEQLKIIENGLLENLDVKQYAFNELEPSSMKKTYEKLHNDKIGLTPYIEKGTPNWLLPIIKKALENNIDVSKIPGPDEPYTSGCHEEILKGLISGIDVSKYSDPKYNNKQMAEIRYGLEKGLNTDIYSNDQFSEQEMEVLREALENKIDVSSFADPRYDWFQLNILCNAKKDNVEISTLTNPDIREFTMSKIYDVLIDSAIPELEKEILIEKIKIEDDMNNLPKSEMKIINKMEELGFNAYLLKKYKDYLNEDIETYIDNFWEEKEPYIEDISFKFYKDNGYDLNQTTEIYLSIKNNIFVKEMLDSSLSRYNMHKIGLKAKDKQTTISPSIQSIMKSTSANKNTLTKKTTKKSTKNQIKR